MKRFDALEKQAHELAAAIQQLRAEIKAEGYQLVPLNLDRAHAGAQEAIKWIEGASLQRSADLTADRDLQTLGQGMRAVMGAFDGRG